MGLHVICAAGSSASAVWNFPACRVAFAAAVGSAAAGAAAAGAEGLGAHVGDDVAAVVLDAFRVRPSSTRDHCFGPNPRRATSHPTMSSCPLLAL